MKAVIYIIFPLLFSLLFHRFSMYAFSDISIFNLFIFLHPLTLHPIFPFLFAGFALNIFAPALLTLFLFPVIFFLLT